MRNGSQWKIGALLLALSSCKLFPGPESHCGGTYGDPIEEARMYCTIDETEPTIIDNIVFEYIKSKEVRLYTNYPYSDHIFPLPANANELNFLVKENGEIKDTLTITYQVEPTFYAGDICNDPQLIPKAVNKQCYSRNRLFKVKAFH